MFTGLSLCAGVSYSFTKNPVSGINQWIQSEEGFFIYIFSIVIGNTFHIYIYKFQILLTNYKHTQTTLGLSGSMSSITVLKAEILVKC